MSIFIAVPGFQDEEFIPTIEDAFAKAENPQDVYIGSRYLSTFNDELDNLEEWATNHQYADNIKIELVLVNENNRFQVFGSTKGRQGSANFYADQDYFLSIDSHCLFGNHWDTELIRLHTEAKEATNNDKTIITAYGAEYTWNAKDERYYTSDHLYQYIGFDFDTPNVEKHEWMKRPLYAVMPPWMVENVGPNMPELLPATKFAYNFSFSDKCFIYDEDFDVFLMEEDMIKTWKLVKDGWTFVHPNTTRPLIGHLYVSVINDDPHKEKVRRGYIRGALGENNEWSLLHQEVRNILRYKNDPEYKDTISKWEDWLKIKVGENSRHRNYIPDTFI